MLEQRRVHQGAESWCQYEKKASERLKLKWFQKLIIGPRSSSDQPMDFPENEADTLMQEETGSRSQRIFVIRS